MIGRLVGLFVLASGTLAADVQPDGGRTSAPWHVGERVRIQWSGFAPNTTVSVRLWDVIGNRSVVIADSIAADDGGMEWTVPEALRAHPYYRLTVHDVRHPGRRQMSGGYIPVEAVLPKRYTMAAKDGDIHVMPNPATSSAVVRWVGPYHTLMVQASDGRIVYRQPLPPGVTAAVLPLEEWAVGMYVVHLVDDHGAHDQSPLVVVR